MNFKCPNCQAEVYNLLTMTDFEKDKMLGCCNCGTTFNPDDTKETANIPEDVNTPEKLQACLQLQAQSDVKLKQMVG